MGNWQQYKCVSGGGISLFQDHFKLHHILACSFVFVSFEGFTSSSIIVDYLILLLKIVCLNLWGMALCSCQLSCPDSRCGAIGWADGVPESADRLSSRYAYLGGLASTQTFILVASPQ